jgi:2-dehydro-3-deoxyphosphogluconate aldolase / (4S)-4-hydroxy-2-oxoglutarate aldolase
MARFQRFTVINEISKSAFIPIFSNPDLSICIDVLSCCYKAGIRIFEFTNRRDFSHEIYAELHVYALNKYPDMILGAGSVLDAGTASIYMQLGANFIVSPILDEAIGKNCNRRRTLWIPGCGSVSEISKAEEMGADIIKIFPGGSVGGPDFVKSVRGPMPWVKLMPTSGVYLTEDSIHEWFSAGSFALGFGSILFTKELILEKRWIELSSNLKQLIQIIEKHKPKADFF